MRRVTCAIFAVAATVAGTAWAHEPVHYDGPAHHSAPSPHTVRSYEVGTRHYAGPMTSSSVMNQETYPDSVPYGGHHPGGYEPKSGKPYYWTGDGVRGMGDPASDPYTYHFGPGFYRSGEFGHARFPYYSYRRPWYDVGHPVYARDTNLPW